MQEWRVPQEISEDEEEMRTILSNLEKNCKEKKLRIDIPLQLFTGKNVTLHFQSSVTFEFGVSIDRHRDKIWDFYRQI